MRKNLCFSKRALALVTAVLLLTLPLLAMAEEAQQQAPITHIATATVQLKVRRSPSKNAGSGDSIPRDAFVYITEYGDDWCKVRTQRFEGYVMTKYLADVLEADVVAQQQAEEAEAMTFETSQENFKESYIAHAVRDLAPVCAQPDLTSYQRANVPCYAQVVVSEIRGDWCFVRYKNVYGYMRVSHLFKWDRLDAYAGDIPGQTVWDYIAFVNKTTSVKDMEKGKVLQTVNPGSAISVGEKDAFGRYPLPYHRTTGYITEEDIAYLMPVVPWDEAEVGDLISVMTTFFGVGKTTLQFQGRNWNIHLASGMISGTILQPGQEYNMNRTIGPYRESTGYHSAPIMSQDKLTGYGGGTCQVNTTFYNAVMQVPLLVTHRKVHAEVGMSYVKQGFDAAVGGGDINLKMINTLPYPIRFVFMNSDGVLTCCVFRQG